MHEEKVHIVNEIGLHARPASKFLKLAASFSSDVILIKNDKEFNGKSILGILSMAAQKGDEVIIRAIGEDEQEAVKELVELIEGGLE